MTDITMEAPKATHGVGDDNTNSADASSVDGDDEYLEDKAAGTNEPSLLYAVCAAMNATRKPSNPEVCGMTKQERRREANRMSARRCRKRRRNELEELEEEIQRLSSESSELASANAKLRCELQDEVASAFEDATVPTMAVATTLERVAATTIQDPWFDSLLRQHLQKRIANDNTMSKLSHPQMNPSGGPFCLPNATAVPTAMGLPASLAIPSTLSLGQYLDTSTMALLQASAMLQSRNAFGGAFDLRTLAMASSISPTLSQMLEAPRNSAGAGVLSTSSFLASLGGNSWLTTTPSMIFPSTTTTTTAAHLEALKGMPNMATKNHHHVSMHNVTERNFCI